jgi:hypothetical protein
VSVADIEARTGQTYSEPVDLARVNAFIEDVSALIESYCRKQFTAPVPAAIKAIAAKEVIAALNVDPGIASERIGDLSTSYGFGGSVVTLSSSTKDALFPYRRTGIGSIRLISPVAEGVVIDPASPDTGVTP